MDWLSDLWFQITAYQRDILVSLGEVLRAGPGLELVALAMALGALHAWTPGHGKLALAAFLTGENASIRRGLGVALAASLMHVVSGAVAYVVLHQLLQQVPTITSRGTPGFVTLGYAIIGVAGLLMIYQAVRSPRSGAHEHYVIAAGIGLLPCPLTVTVLGFALTQGSAWSALLLLLALAAGISLTIGTVAGGTVLFRDTLQALLEKSGARVAAFGRGVQGICGGFVVALAAWGLS